MLYLDAMALPRRFHKPDLFITITCNPKWPEIAAAIPSGSHWRFHPDIVARVFFLKFVEMMKDLTERQIFGKVLAYVWRVEWQVFRDFCACVLELTFSAGSRFTARSYVAHIRGSCPVGVPH